VVGWGPSDREPWGTKDRISVWIAGGLILIGWGYRTKARGIMLINAVNVIMAVSAFAALI